MGLNTQKIAMDQIFITSHFSYTKTLIPMYRFRVKTYFVYHHFGVKKRNPPPPPPNLKTLSWIIFHEAFIAAPLFLYLCLEVFEAWVNQNILSIGIFVESIAMFAKNGLLTQRLCCVLNIHCQLSFIHSYHYRDLEL